MKETNKTFVAFVSPTLVLDSRTSRHQSSDNNNDITAFASTAATKPLFPSALSFTVHCLPDPSLVVTGSRIQQLRPYLLYPRQESTLQNVTSIAYQLCEMTLIQDDSYVTKDDHAYVNNADNPDSNQFQSFFLSTKTNDANTDTTTITSLTNDTITSSFIVQNGSLYVITPVDPLFWLFRDTYLSTTTEDNATVTDSKQRSSQQQQQQQWQPLSQFMQDYDPVIRQSIVEPTRHNNYHQYQHVLKEYVLSADEDEVLVQFSVDKALVWLQCKQQKVEQYLLLQQQQTTLLQLSSSSCYNSNNNTNSTQHNNSNSCGAFTAGFTIATSTAEKKPATDTAIVAIPNETVQQQDQASQEQQRQQQRVHEESIQLVCHYLSPAWQDCFLQYIHTDRSVLQHPPSKEKLNDTHSKRFKVLTEEGATQDGTLLTIPITGIRVDWNQSLTTTNTTAATTTIIPTTGQSKSSTSKSVLKPITAGAKRLLKVNQRGIQSVSSFFGGGTNKKKDK
jgi:hypothetical protein